MIFSDGATRGNGKRNNIGAYAYILTYQNQYEEFAEASCDTTNNQQELLGIISALKRVERLVNVPTVVYSDSKYSIEGVEWMKKWKANGWKTSNKQPVKNKELWIELDKQINKFQEIHFRYIAGHQDNGNYNDRCDFLCNQIMDKLEQEKETTQTT
jgi:ribonuclease HI